MSTLATIRGRLLAIFVLGTLGTSAELLLIEHTEGFSQLAPLLASAASLVVLGWHLLRRSAASLLAFQGTMVLVVLSGAAGLVLHYRGNVEFELEMRPGESGFALFLAALKGATPALAPGTMILLGLIGLTYAHRDPAVTEN